MKQTILFVGLTALVGCQSTEVADPRLDEIDAKLAEIDQRAGALDRTAAEQQKTQEFLRQRAKEIAQAERQIIATTEGWKANSFGDGTHEVGVDIQPGKYKTKGPAGEASCYWEFRNRQGNKTRNDSGRGRKYSSSRKARLPWFRGSAEPGSEWGIRAVLPRPC